MAMDRNLALELVRATEAAALACARLMGRGDEWAADQAAVDAMRTALNRIEMDATAMTGFAIPADCKNVVRWFEVASGRPSVVATTPPS